MRKQMIVWAMLFLFFIPTVTAEEFEFKRFFEEIPLEIQYKDKPVYLFSVGSDFCDSFIVDSKGFQTYDFGISNLEGKWLLDPIDTNSIMISNGIRTTEKGLWDKLNIQCIEMSSDVIVDRSFRCGVTIAHKKATTNQNVYFYMDMEGKEIPLNGITVAKIDDFLNGVADITFVNEDGSSSIMTVDRNFKTVLEDVHRVYKWERTPLKDAGFLVSGNEWRGKERDSDDITVPIVFLLDNKYNILKEFPQWEIVRNLTIIDMEPAKFNNECGHIVLAKGPKNDPEYLILKNKLYPYTEYGDIRFDSIRPAEKIEPSRVLNLFEDRMVVRGTGDAQDKVGIMDFDGKWTMKPMFRSIGAFHNGLAPAQDGGGKFGYITKDGAWAIAPIYDAAADFGCGYAAVVRDGIPMYIDDSGVVRKEFTAGTELGQFSERFAWVKENGTYSLLDMEFAPQFSGAYETVTPYCNGLSRVRQGGQELFLDLDGNVKFEVADGASVSGFRDEFAIQKKDGVVEKIGKSGNVTDTYDQYTNVVDLGNGLMLGETSGGGVEVFDLFGYVLEQHEKTKLAELDDGTVLLVPEKGTWFTGIRKDDYFALWDQSYPQSLLKGNDGVIALLPGENLLYVGGEAKRIDMENAEVTPEVKDERTMVPLRVVSETLGYSVDWKEPDVTVTDYIDGEKKEIRLTMGSTTLVVTDTDGTVQQETMDVAPYEENGRTMVPLRFVAEQLGQQVHWDESGLVLISEAKMEPTPINIAQYLALWE